MFAIEKCRQRYVGVSLIALAVASVPAAPALAQTATSGTANADAQAAASTDTQPSIIVTGSRRALKTAQQIKRNSDTVVDSITATDIGAFPDKSVAEALQRVPGVTVNRFAASDDTSHFSADPSGVLVRGLSQVRSEYNGRDTFSANSSRGLSWGDIAPELMAGVDVYKNQTAQLIEGGLAGTINLRTRVPFDTKGQTIDLNVIGNYGDLRQKVTPEISGLYSNRWTTGFGDVGVMVDAAFSKVATESQGITFGRTAVFKGVYGPGTQYIPSSVGERISDYDRTRKGFAGALQWRSLSGKVTTTAQFNRSQYHETWRERGVISYLTDLYALPANFAFTSGGPFNSRIPRPAPGTSPFTFDQSGNFLGGTLVNQQTDFSWWGGAATLPNFTGQASSSIALNDRGQPMLLPCYSWGNAANPTPGACGPDARGPDLNAVTRFNDTHRMTQDASFNVKWNPSDRLEMNFDAQYVDSNLQNYDVEVGQYSFANTTLDTSGDVPRMTFSAPTNINQSAGGLSNPNNYRYNHAMDHVEDDDGHEWALRADGAYRLGGSWLDSLNFGVRYADRDQTVRYSAYNWGNIVNDWNLNSNQYLYWNIDRTAPAPSIGFTGYPTGLYDVRNFGSNFLGGTGQYAFFNMDQLANHGADHLSFSNIGVGQDQWEPICSNGGTRRTGPRTGETAGTCFRPDEINTLSETSKAAYAMLKFDNHVPSQGAPHISGNVGVRLVDTLERVAGSTVYPLINPASYTCQRNTAVPGAPVPTLPYSLGCYLFGNAALIASNPQPGDILLAGSPDAARFANGAGVPGTARARHTNVLPSLNVRVDLNPNWLVRFAASRALSRPDIGLLKNYTTVFASLPGADRNDPRYIKDANGNVIGVKPTYTGSGYNPRLKPTTADMFDLTVENYFAAVGQFSAGLFYKKFHNYIQYGSSFVDFTNNGVTNTVEVRGPSNGRGGYLWGAEASYQRFFDFLPGALSGLGMQVNGTYVANRGISNSGLKNQNGSNGGAQAQPGSGGTVLSVNSLEGLSKYTYNIVGMYEKYGLAVRIAYNWRSKFLVTAVDCCTYLPAWQMAAGYLDGSIRYAVTPHVEVSLQGSNLLNTKVRLKQQVTGADQGAVLVPNSWFQNDRRFQLGVRAKF